MTIAGIGLDMVEVARIERLLARSPEFGARYFTPGEQGACAAAARPAEQWAARFAVKEAFLKALGMGVLGSIALCDIHVTMTEEGAARVDARGGARAALAGLHPWVSVVVRGGRAWATVVLAPASD